jgi:hypothetical protein
MILLLCVSSFHTLLLAEKLFVSAVMSTLCLMTMWLFSPDPIIGFKVAAMSHPLRATTAANTSLFSGGGEQRPTPADFFRGLCSFIADKDPRLVDHWAFFSVLVLFAFLLVAIQSRRSEMVARLDFIWKIQALGENVEVKRTLEQNRKILENILPAHVACHFMTTQPSKVYFLN